MSGVASISDIDTCWEQAGFQACGNCECLSIPFCLCFITLCFHACLVNSSNYSSNYGKCYSLLLFLSLTGTSEEVDSPQTQNRHGAYIHSGLILRSSHSLRSFI
jgi:hypothetical protein